MADDSVATQKPIRKGTKVFIHSLGKTGKVTTVGPKGMDQIHVECADGFRWYGSIKDLSRDDREPQEVAIPEPKPVDEEEEEE